MIINNNFSNYSKFNYTKQKPLKNNPSFNGILLKNVDFEDVRKIAFFLKFKGYHNLGFQRIYLKDNKMSSLIAATKRIRKIDFTEEMDDFGAVIFPWAKKAYIIGNRKEEPNILDQIYRVTSKAQLHTLV